jgi:exodeoxyribonuclease VII large subunit
VVTSPTGAAIRDILTILRRRCPLTHVLIYPVPVQGETAAEHIAHAIGSLNRAGQVDVIIVGRGGGSWEDLWAFNEEAVVRAVAASVVPVVSAVGHEIDYTLADFAADLRAPTPSAAAEAVVPVLEELVETLGHLIARQRQAMQSRVHAIRHALVSRSGVLPCIQLRIQQEAQRLDDMAAHLTMYVRNLSGINRQRLFRHCAVLDRYSPRVRLRGAWVLVSQLTKRAEQRMLGLVALRRQALRTVGAGLQGLSPLAVLARGYSIVQRAPDGRVIHAADEVAAGDEVTARLEKGRLLCQVRKVLPDTG